MPGSQANTPFIPPLSTPEGRSPAVIPGSVGHTTPAWTGANHSLQPGYPMYPPTPYNATPFIPQMSVHPTPNVPPGSYFPPPINLPQTGPPPATTAGGAGGAGQGGVSTDYTGYPQFANPAAAAGGWGPAGAAAAAAAAAAAMYTPWAMGGQQPLPPGWGPPGGYPPFGMHPGHPGGPGMMGPMMGGGGGPGAWAPPYATPAPYGGGPSLWPHAPGPSTTWPPGAPPAHETRLPLREKGYDVINPFAIGKNYGPVLDPFLVAVVRADLRVNPLLLPADDATDRVYLKWNMLFHSSYCLRSTDPPHKSWIAGRNEPATFPRVTHLRIISRTFPWMINIRARDTSVGVTCGEVIDGIDEHLHRLAKGDEYKTLNRERQKAIKDAYSHNRAPAHGVPGGALGEGLRYLDWLCQETMYGGIERDDSFVRGQCRELLPCTVVLNCIHRYPLTENEIQEQAQREQAVQRERERRERRRSRVEDADSD